MKYVFLMFIVFLSIKAAATEVMIEYQCPERIETVQKVKEPVGVWRESVVPPFSDGTEGKRNYSEHNLDYVGFSDGVPEERAFLIPDNEHELNSELWVARWEFINSESIWVSCQYRQTTVQLSQKIPAGIKKCFVQGDDRKGITVQRVWCEG